MPKHIILVCAGLVLGILANWWIQPDTSAGSTTLITLTVLLTEGVGALLTLVLRLAARRGRQPGDTPPQSPAKLVGAGLIIATALYGTADAQQPAPTGAVTVVNQAKQALTGVSIVPATSGTHGANLLGGSALASGQTRLLPADTSHGCNATIHGVFADGVAVQQGADLCAHETVVFNDARPGSTASVNRPSPSISALQFNASRNSAAIQQFRRGAATANLSTEQATVTEARRSPAAPTPGPVASASPAPAAPVPALVAPKSAGIGALAGPAPRLHPARVFMAGSEIPPAGVGAYGVVALKSTPTPADTARLTAACTAFLSHLPPQSDLPATVPLSEQMLTIWPLRPAGQAAAEQGSCPDMLANYQLDAGLSAIADAQTPANHLDGRGPFLIGWSPSNMRGVKDAVVLVVDMSTLDSQASFNDAFLFWQQKIVEDPSLWQHGFSAERVRLSLRDFLDQYGGSIQDAVKIFVHG